MSGKFLARASALSLAFVLAACGEMKTPLLWPVAVGPAGIMEERAAAMGPKQLSLSLEAAAALASSRVEFRLLRQSCLLGVLHVSNSTWLMREPETPFTMQNRLRQQSLRFAKMLISTD